MQLSGDTWCCTVGFVFKFHTFSENSSCIMLTPEGFHFKSFVFWRLESLKLHLVCRCTLFTAGLLMIVEPRLDGNLPGHMLFLFPFAYISSSITLYSSNGKVPNFHHCTLVIYLRLFFWFFLNDMYRYLKM